MLILRNVLTYFCFVFSRKGALRRYGAERVAKYSAIILLILLPR